jgi:hypothetical protein
MAGVTLLERPLRPSDVPKEEQKQEPKEEQKK